MRFSEKEKLNSIENSFRPFQSENATSSPPNSSIKVAIPCMLKTSEEKYESHKFNIILSRPK